jgi:lipoate-protein ligase B
MNRGIRVNVVTAYRLGTVEYKESRRLQEDLAKARASGTVGDTLLLLQHPPVITIGRGGGEEDVLAPGPTLSQLGVRVLPTDRGGRATYHGPGQLVVYPILRPPNGDLHAYAWRLEETAIRVLSSYGLRAGRVDGHPGVWIGSSNGTGGGGKIAAVGIAVRDGITRHGLALNVAPEMAHFHLLVSCGNTGGRVTSMAQELGWEPDLEEVTERFGQTFGQVFACQVVEGVPDMGVPQEGVPQGGRAAALVGHSAAEPEQPTWLWQRISPQAEDVVAPQHRRVLWSRHGDVHDLGRFLQPGLSFLRREAGESRAAGSW